MAGDRRARDPVELHPWQILPSRRETGRWMIVVQFPLGLPGPLPSPFAGAEGDLPLAKRLKGVILARNIGYLPNVG